MSPDASRAGRTSAMAILAASALVTVGGVLAAASADFGDSDGSEALRFRIKLAALSSLPFGFFSSLLTGGFVVGVAVLVALALANGGGSPVGPIGTGATAVAGILGALTVASLVVDFTLLSEEGIEVLSVVAAVLGDVAALVVLGTAAWAGAQASRGDT